MTAAIKRLAGGGKLAVDACKLPHHGSKANVLEALLKVAESYVQLQRMGLPMRVIYTAPNLVAVVRQ